MNHYKVVNEHLSHRMDVYMEEATAAEKAADKLVASVGGDGFVGSPYGDFGGVIAISFGPGKKAPLYFRKAGEDGGVMYYEPAVQNTVTIETDGFIRGLEHRQNVRCWYDYRKVSLQQARSQLSYASAIELAGITWSGTDISRLSRKYRVSPAWIKIYAEKRMPYASLVAKSCKEGLRMSHQRLFDEELREALELEALLDEQLGKMQLYLVRKVAGTKRAVSFVRKASELPMIPSGKLFELLDLQFDPGQESAFPAFFKSDGVWYLGTSGKIKSDLVESISEMSYNIAKSKRGES